MSTSRLPAPRLPVNVSSYVVLVGALVVVWGVGDAVSTLWAIEATGSIDGEANPWIRTLLAHDPALLLVLKAGVVTVAGGLLIRYRSFVESVPGWRVWFLGVLGMGAAIVATNVYVGLVAVA